MKLTKNERRALEYYRRYKQSSMYNLYYAYERPSREKLAIEQRYINFQGYKIISYNIFGFTCGYFKDNTFTVETKESTYKISTEKLEALGE